MELVSPEAVQTELARLSWQLEGHELVKVVKKADFAAALAYVNAVGRLAEEADHHPDIDIRWNTVTLRQYSHSLGGISGADLALAHAIDALDD